MFPSLRKLARVFLGTGSGMLLGVAIGIATNNLAIGIVIGLVFGTGTGAAWELKKKPQEKSEG